MVSATQLFEFHDSLHRDSRLQSYPTRVVDSLRVLTDFDVASYSEVDIPRAHVMTRDFPEQPSEIQEGRARYLRQHPIWPRIVIDGHMQPHRLSDNASQISFMNTDIYNTVYRIMGCARQLVVPLTAGTKPTLRHVALHRSGRDFGDDEVRTLAAMRPAFLAAYEHSRVATELGLMTHPRDELSSETHGCLFVTDRWGRVELMTDAARMLVARHFEPLPACSFRLPFELERCVAQVIARSTTHPSESDWYPIPSRIVPKTFVMLRSIQRDTIGSSMLFVVAERENPVDKILRGSGLSRRRSEVAWHVKTGCSNAEIATRMGITKRTVDTHVHHVLEQLGLGSRYELMNYVAKLGV